MSKMRISFDNVYLDELETGHHCFTGYSLISSKAKVKSMNFEGN